jgi:hypothetical protein
MPIKFLTYIVLIFSINFSFSQDLKVLLEVEEGCKSSFGTSNIVKYTFFEGESEKIFCKIDHTEKYKNKHNRKVKTRRKTFKINYTIKDSKEIKKFLILDSITLLYKDYENFKEDFAKKLLSLDSLSNIDNLYQKIDSVHKFTDMPLPIHDEETYVMVKFKTISLYIKTEQTREPLMNYWVDDSSNKFYSFQVPLFLSKYISYKNSLYRENYGWIK